MFRSARWMVQMHGAAGTLYANELFTLQVDFPENYPMEAPQVQHQNTGTYSLQPLVQYNDNFGTVTTIRAHRRYRAGLP